MLQHSMPSGAAHQGDSWASGWVLRARPGLRCQGSGHVQARRTFCACGAEDGGAGVEGMRC